MKKNVSVNRAYVLVDGEGMWLSRPFGSAVAADKAGSKMADGYYTILEITTAIVIKSEIEF